MEERIVRCDAIDALSHYTVVSSLLFILDDQHSMIPITATPFVRAAPFFNYMQIVYIWMFSLEVMHS